jgi:predicted RNase H-like HicB family nuclease
VSSAPPNPRLPVTVRAQGVTPAERYLQRLCERCFLSLWSYPSVFRDQKTGAKGDGKELSDLLVVFGDDILIFSDKSCAFPQTGDVHLDWSRWFRVGVSIAAIIGLQQNRGNQLQRQFDVVIERDDDGYYIVSIPQIPGCHTQARSLDEAMDRIRAAAELCLEVEVCASHAGRAI